MIHALLGTKLSQSQTFTEEGKRIPVTRIQAGPCWVTRVRDMGGYRNVQLGFGTAKNISKPLAGHIKKTGLETKPRFLREVRVHEAAPELKPGSTISVGDVFQIGDAVAVTGVSKGKGFAGVVKRHGFAGGPRTHGQSDRERAPGSVGQSTTPGRIYKGKRMAGRMGGQRVTIKGLRVVAVDPKMNLLTLMGLVPGASRGVLLIQKES